MSKSKSEKPETVAPETPITQALEMAPEHLMPELPDGLPFHVLMGELGAEALSLPDRHDWDDDPILCGIVLDVRAVEVEDTERGVIVAPLLLEVDTPDGIVSTFGGAALELIFYRLLHTRRPKSEKRETRDAAAWNELHHEARGACAGNVVLIRFVGHGVKRNPGWNPPRLFDGWNLGPAGAQLERPLFEKYVSTLRAQALGGMTQGQKRADDAL